MSAASRGDDPFATPFQQALEALRACFGPDAYVPDLRDGRVGALCPVCQAPGRTLTIVEPYRDADHIDVHCTTGCSERAIGQALAHALEAPAWADPQLAPITNEAVYQVERDRLDRRWLHGLFRVLTGEEAA